MKGTKAHNNEGAKFRSVKILLLRAFALLCLCPFPSPLYAGAGEDLLTGSVVTSDKGRLVRGGGKQLMIYDGNVVFQNPTYLLKADHCVRDYKARTWTLNGSVYCLHKFGGGSNLELYCDHGTYFESIEKAEVFRGAAPVRMKYVSADGKLLKGRCNRIIADNAKASMDFLGDFYMQTQEMEIFSDNGFYSDTDHSFLIYNSLPGSGRSAPVAIGTRGGRDFAMTSEKMKFFKDTGDVKLYNKVAGWVKALKADRSAP